MHPNMHIVNFEDYCKTCKYHGEDGSTGEHCEECLATPAREDTHKPLNYKNATKKGEKS